MRQVAIRLTMANTFIALALLLSDAAAGQVTEAPGSWTTAAPLPDQRTEVSVTSDGERLSLLGGFGPGRRAPRAIHAYDPAADRWSQIADLPEGVNHAGLAHVDGSPDRLTNGSTAIDALSGSASDGDCATDGLPPCSSTDCRRSKRPVARPSTRASTRPT